jgi:hypothetical protein
MAGGRRLRSRFFKETAMDRLLTMDKDAYVSRMQEECRRIMEQIADAVNAAPTGNAISGSEMQVRDLMAELRRKAFETALQMRIDSTESSFSPSEGCIGSSQRKEGAGAARERQRQRPRSTAPRTLRQQGPGQ